MNRVLVKDAESGARKAYDLEPETDTFWKTHAPRPFPEAIEENSQELQRIKEKEAWVKNKVSPLHMHLSHDEMCASPFRQRVVRLRRRLDRGPVICSQLSTPSHSCLRYHSSLMVSIAPPTESI